MNHKRSILLLLVAVPIFGCGGTQPAELSSQETKVVEPSAQTTSSSPVESGETKRQIEMPPATPTRASMPSGQQNQLLADARSAVEGGDLTGAEELLKEVAQVAASTDADRKAVAEARYNLGVISEWQGQYRAAKRHYEASLRHDPELGVAVVAVGRLILRDGDPAAAVSYAQGRLVGKAKSTSLRNAVNRLRLAAGIEYDVVERDSKQVLREDEKNAPAMVNLAAAFHQQGKYELAIAILENAKALDQGSPEIYWRLAAAHLKLAYRNKQNVNEEEKRRAQNALEEATRLPLGASAEVYNDLGLLYHQAGDFAGAELQFRKALARWPDMVSAQINLGNALKGQQRYQEAREAFQTARTKSPGNAAIAYNLGILLLDGQFPDLESLPRLEQSIAYFQEYKEQTIKFSKDDPVNAYIKEAEKRVEVETKLAAQRRRSPKPAEAEPEAADDSFGETSEMVGETSDVDTSTEESGAAQEGGPEGAEQ